MQIREAAPQDFRDIFAVLKEAFPSDAESNLVKLLCAHGNLSISLVATLDSKVVGYLAFSPVSLNGVNLGLGLAPVAIKPRYQSQGYGVKLIEAGLGVARSSSVGTVVVLGDPAYYSRFGFRAAAQWNLNDEYGGGLAFQALELIPGFIPESGGLVQYGEEFQIV